MPFETQYLLILDEEGISLMQTKWERPDPNPATTYGDSDGPDIVTYKTSTGTILKIFDGDERSMLDALITTYGLEAVAALFKTKKVILRAPLIIG